jgi:hypothetical protein
VDHAAVLADLAVLPLISDWLVFKYPLAFADTETRALRESPGSKSETVVTLLPSAFLIRLST